MKPTPSIEDQISGAAYTKKSVAYAFPTSHMARKYNSGEAFYYIEISSPTSICPAFGEGTLALPAWRFESAAEAERAADTLPFEYAGFYKLLPLRGSRFYPSDRQS
jgi:hypothetical protein